MRASTHHQFISPQIILGITGATFTFLALLILQSCESPPSGPVYVATRPPAPTPQSVIDSTTGVWLRQNCMPFQTSNPGAGFDDIAFLENLYGGARVIVLGDATNGTKEFFQMKDRILRFLVEKMGFNTFAIEGNWSECNLINNYIQNGTGDPGHSLASLNVWAWNTAEVMDMIYWMRSHNEKASGTKVSFFGFDFQYPGLAMDSVVAYLKRVDSAAADEAELLYGPFRPYQAAGFRYVNAPATVKDNCQLSISRVYDRLLEHRTEYELKTSSKEFLLALHSARVVVQAEDYFSARNYYDYRDMYMGENARWVVDQGGANSRTVLWTNNLHYYWLGQVLKNGYGAGNVIFIAFDFYAGSFNAASPYNSTTGRGGIVTVVQADTPMVDTYEHMFRMGDVPRFLLDMRDSKNDARLGGKKFRTIEGVYDPTNPGGYYSSVSLRYSFDAIIYFQASSPTTLRY